MSRNYFSGTPLLAILLILSNAAAGSAASAYQDTSGSPMCSGEKNGAPLLEEMDKRVNNMGDYKFDGAVDTIKGRDVVKATGTFYFKPSNRLRVEVQDYGSKSGSILVKRQDGKIKAKAGKSMFGIKMNLAPDSRLLQLPNGLNILECDLGSLFNRLKKESVSGSKLVSGGQPIKVESLATPVILLETQASKPSGVEIVERVFIDPAQKIPVQWDLFNNGKFASRVWFKSFQSKANWNDSQFDL